VGGAERFGLVAAGGVTRSLASRLPALMARLGPVKGVSFSTARRMTASLRAGQAVANYAALADCQAIWIEVPEVELESTVRDLEAQTPIHRTVVVICGSERESTAFEVLRARSGRVATLNEAGAGMRGVYVAEGHAEAVRLIRRLVESDRQRLLELRTGSKAAYLAGVHMATELLRPWVAAAIGCLQSAGIPRPEAAALAGELAARATRSHARLGEKPWGGATEAELRRLIESRVMELRARDQRGAELYSEGLRLTLAYFGKGKARPRAVGQHA
jgi:hypothetical protein